MRIQELFPGGLESGLSYLFEPVTFEPNQQIFKAGEPGDCCYLIDQGEVRIEADRHEIDTDSVLAYLGEGMVVGEVALLDSGPRSANAFAHTRLQARKLSIEKLAELEQHDPLAMVNMVKALAKSASSKLRQTNEKLADVIFPERDKEVEEMVARAKQAQEEFAQWDENRIDELIQALAGAVAIHAGPLAEATVAETRMGNIADKTFKNQVASMGVAQTLIGQRGAGSIGGSEQLAITEIASPVGVVFGLVPQTNPVATAIFKTLIALKSRNAMILSFHHTALGVANQFGEILFGVLEQYGAPHYLIQWVKARTNRKKTAAFMSHSDVGLVLATGGAGMVRAAYSSGTPALGVGPGNAPVLVTASANLEHAAHSIVISKSFDNGLICGSEHNLIVDASVRDRFIAALERQGAAVLNADEAKKFNDTVVNPTSQTFRPQVVGQSAAAIAKFNGIERPFDIKLIVVSSQFDGKKNAWAGEKMSPMLSLFTTGSLKEGIELSVNLLQYMGTGHTAIIHSTDEAAIQRFAHAMPASRILVNSPGSHGVVGYTTGLLPSFTLGCGTFGGNSTTDNVGFRNLTNVKRLARFIDPIARGLAAPPEGAALPLSPEKIQEP
jgi:acyl-CoA reductase-like NAD-dependent aldehyde dehydrogenase